MELNGPTQGKTTMEIKNPEKIHGSNKKMRSSMTLSKIAPYLSVFLLLIPSLFSTCAAVEVPLKSGNHAFSDFKFSGRKQDCSYELSPIDFCDGKHMGAINNAIQTMAPNFNHNFIMLYIREREEYFERSLVAIDTTTGIVYPLPFDSYSGTLDKDGNADEHGRLEFSLNSNKVCVDGSILAHREGNNGRLCWAFDGEKFVGHRTPYTY